MLTSNKELLSLKDDISRLAKDLTLISLKLDKLIEEEETDDASDAITESITPEVIEHIKNQVICELKSIPSHTKSKFKPSPVVPKIKSEVIRELSSTSFDTNRPNTNKSTSYKRHSTTRKSVPLGPPFSKGERVIITNNVKNL